ncbi:MAG: hypothetical protein JST75_07550 [Bacteroidetes bacterium]|nr:hypothetical protein [Bacteroidota bacterium]
MMNRVIKRISYTIVLCLLMVTGFAQNTATKILENQFDTYRSQSLQEKLFIHTDRNFYLTGEILWMKLYDVDGFFNMPLAVSTIAYVEILDKNNKPMLQSKLALNKGDGDGSIYLPVTLNSGNYKLRAYTNWMKNFGADYFFEKPITIINSQKIPDAGAAQQSIKYDIGFYPEGGNLVAGIQSKIGFRVTDQYGVGQDFQGLLIDNNDTILKFMPSKFGIGHFNFTPAARHTYKALIRLTDGKTEIKDLPAVNDAGYVMHLSEAGDQLRISLQSNVASQANQPVYLFAHTRGSIKSVQESNVQNGTAGFLVDIKKLGDGISHFTIFNNNRQPVCERIYFKYPARQLKISAQADQEQYASRKKINISVSSSASDGIANSANMSMAVFRLDSLQNPDASDINSYFWLESDLGPGIESPSYYFKNETPEVKEAMDNLMLTHGWRRFDWNDILQNKKTAFEFVPEYYGHIITGRVVDTKTNLPGKNIDGYLSVPGTKSQFRLATSDDNGKIKFEMKDFYGSQEIIVQTNPLKDSVYRIDIASPFFDKYTRSPLPHFVMPEKNPATLLDASINMQVQNIYSGVEAQQFSMPVIDTGSFYALPDQTYLLDKYTRFTTMEEVLREYVTTILVKKRSGKFHIPIMDINVRESFDDDPLVLFDGVPVFDMDKLMQYDPLKINRLDVMARKYIMGYTNFDGIASFTSYKGDLTGFELDPHAVAVDYESIQLQRKFYSPEYITEKEINSHLPDFRTLLFWEPQIKTDSSGKQSISFYSSDLPGKYAVVLQGMNNYGMTGSTSTTFQVK